MALKSGEQTFPMSLGATLELEDLEAQVTVSATDDGPGTLTVHGTDEQLRAMNFDASSPDRVTLSGMLGVGGGVSVRASVRGGGLAVASARGSIIVVGSGSEVVVNGRRITGSSDGVALKADEPAKIDITVPRGTVVRAKRVPTLVLRGTSAAAYLTLGGKDRASIANICNVEITAAGQSHCDGVEVSGLLQVEALGQSKVDLDGTFDRVAISTGGQSEVQVNGRCASVVANAGGQSEIKVRGSETNMVRERATGQAEISIE